MRLAERAPAPSSGPPPRTTSLRRYLLLGILLPVLGLVGINSVSHYREALEAANTAYDRTLLASAKTISEQLDVKGVDNEAQLIARVPYAALEAFEADNQSRMYYKVSTPGGALVSGYEDLPEWQGKVPLHTPYAALVDFYDDQYRGEPVRVAALLQPVASIGGQGIALIQVAETLELRETLARQLLVNTLWRQGLLVLVIGFVVVMVVQRATQPVRTLSDRLRQRPENDLTPIESDGAPRELWPLINATNQVMARLAHLLEHQRRFVRDTSHQLRTPLAVLKVQVQSALRGDQAPEVALNEIQHTVDRATRMANQMLALAKVEQLRDQAQASATSLNAAVREVALDVAPLIAEKGIEFDIDTDPTWVRAHEWMLSELTRNLLHNAVKHTPRGLSVKVQVDASSQGLLRVSNDGPAISDTQRERLFQPFAAMGGQMGAGLGLAICRSIVDALDGRIDVRNREAEDGSPGGVDVLVWLPLRG